MAFFDDTKQLVSEGVRRDVELRISLAETPDSKKNATHRGKEREKALKKWLALDRPLAYGHMDDGETFESLVKAVIPFDKDISYGLPNFEAHAMAPSQFVRSLLDMSAPSTPTSKPSSPRAPVLARGSFLPMLKEAHRHLLILSGVKDVNAQASFCSKIFSRMVDYLQIRFVPSYHQRPHPATCGAPSRKPVFNSWAQLGLPDSRSSRTIPQPPPHLPSSERAAALALTNAIAADANAEWSTEDLTLATLHSVLQKTRLPVNYTLPKPAEVAYVDETYIWVRDTYDGTKPIHHLALLVGIITSFLLPNLFMPATVQKSTFSDARTNEAVRDLYATIPWVAKSKKGMTDKRIFVSMVTTYIIALYEPTSPLRSSIAASKKKGLGDSWTQKHCPSSSPFLLFPA